MHKICTYSFILLFALSCAGCTISPRAATNAPAVQKDNFVFAIKGTDTLTLDRYELPSGDSAGKRPVVMFAFGGGFKGGNKAQACYLPYFEFLAHNGFVVVSIDYRTALKNMDPATLAAPEDFVGVMQNAVDTAVDDLYDATLYVISQGDSWGIDTRQIVISGSSAGALMVLQAEYNLCQGKESAKRLPENFNYAGVIACAGAISDPRAPRWDRMPCPMMLFHGDADKTVPFQQAVVEDRGGFWGSAAIARSLQDIQASYYFYVVENAGHEIAGVPLLENEYEIMSFLSRQVLAQQRLAVTTVERVEGDSAVKKDFTWQDYIQDNLR